MMTIRPSVRAVLFLKAALLLAFAAVFGLIAFEALTGHHAWWARVLALASAFPGPFLVKAASRGLFDVLFGQAITIDGAVALDSKQRRIGYSVRLPDGRMAEFPLFNPGTALVPGQRYQVVVGRYSNVIVEPPKAL